MAARLQIGDKTSDGRCNLREVIWKDERGFVRKALVRNGDPDELAPEHGLPRDPPDLDGLDWEAIKRDLHNELTRRGLYDYQDVQRKQNSVSKAVRTVVTRRLLRLYKENMHGN